MNKENFYNEIKNMITEHYKDEAVISMHDVRKNNDVVLKGICVMKANTNCGPTIYLDGYYENFCNGRSLGSITDEIIEIVDEHMVEDNVDMSFYSDYDKVADKVCFRLIGRRGNEDLLKDMPSRSYEDLEIVYYVSLKLMGIEGCIHIKNEHMEMWDITENDLYEAALANTEKHYPSSIKNIFNVVNDLSKTSDDIYEEDDLPNIYVVSNTGGHYGAACILYPGFLDAMREKISKAFYILPSSIHELIIVPDDETENKVEVLQNMVKCVNRECLKTEDILSDSVYYYDFGYENNVKKVEHDNSAMVL